MKNIKALTDRNAERWATAKLTRASEFGPVAKRLVAQKVRYQDIEAMTGVPWFVIAAIHQRESAQDFSKSIAQGDPWNKKSTHVPKGRGPFKSFEEAAVDALKNCAPYASKWKDWSPGGTMTLLEQYNGLGYANKGIPSPYIWSGTDQYTRGKYIADGKFSATAVDKQLGCAGLILAMQKLDDTIQFGAMPTADVPPTVPSTGVRGDPEVWNIQRRLKAMKYNPGGLDGIWGGMTSGAISGFINDRQSNIAPPASAETFLEVLEQLKSEIAVAEVERFVRPIAPERAEATPAEVGEKLPEVKASIAAERGGFWASISTAAAAVITGISKFFGDAVEWLNPIKEFAGDLPWPVWVFGALLLSAALYYISRKSGDAKNAATQAYQEGARV